MAPRARSEASDIEIAARVRRFVAVLRDFTSGAIDASGLALFARELWPEKSGQGTPFPGNGLASVAFDSIWRPSDPELRSTDVQGYIRWLTVGASNFPVRVCGVRVNAASLAERLSLPTQRYIMAGLGWLESVEFASPITGR